MLLIDYVLPTGLLYTSKVAYKMTSVWYDIFHLSDVSRVEKQLRLFALLQEKLSKLRTCVRLYNMKLNTVPLWQLIFGYYFSRRKFVTSC